MYSNYGESNYEDNPIDHNQIINQMREIATQQEAQIYSMFYMNWRAQLDPKLRDWIEKTRKNNLQNNKQQTTTAEQFDSSQTYDVDQFLQIS
ncbi:hypothetical protein pb186bvf_019477 [Paramecium bursaria]